MQEWDKKNLALFGLLGLGLALLSAAMAETDHSASAASAVSESAAGLKKEVLALASTESMMKKSDCFTCHSVKRKVIGPAYKDVAKKYKGDPTALLKLVKKVREGGSGNWGQVPMAAHPNIKEEDLTQMVQWVLKQK